MESGAQETHEMISRMGTWAVIAMVSLMCACARNQEPGTEQVSPPSAKEASTTAAKLPPVSVLVGHQVTDFDAWKQVFDDHMQDRKDASCLGHYTKQGMDDPGMVYVYCLATDADKLRAFLDSADLAEAMRSAGVDGTPEITLMKPMSRDLIPEQRLPGIIVRHRVKNYDSWREKYRDFDGFLRESGIVGYAISREFDDPNNVIVYHQARDVADLRAFVGSVELEDTMQHADVIGEPDIRFIQVVDFAKY
jgi:hypothetical protein